MVEGFDRVAIALEGVLEGEAPGGLANLPAHGGVEKRL